MVMPAAIAASAHRQPTPRADTISIPALGKMVSSPPAGVLMA
jgi:hypothetical protein